MAGEVATRRIIETTASRKPDTRKPEPVIASLRLHIICVVLTLLAAFVFTLTEHDDHKHTIWCIFEISVQTILVIVATVYFRTRIALLKESSIITPMLVMVGSLSLICEPFQRMLFDTGHSFEILIMHSQCNLMLALAVCGFRVSFQRLAVLIAVFLTLFCCTISTSRGLLPLASVFALVAVIWLIASWWEAVDRRLLRTSGGRLPRGWLVACGLIPIMLLLAAGSAGSRRGTSALSGFMPSSGGTGDYSPFSRGGVNDGDALVAGDNNIRSFAPIEDAPFIEDNKPSMFDVFNESFDGEVKRNKGEQQRAIALPPDLLKHVHQKMAEARKSGREFSLIRGRKSRNQQQMHDLQTLALFHVAGRTPVHLRTEVYDIFDGERWAPVQEELQFDLKMKETEDRHWLNVPQPGKGFEMFSGTATHMVKTANLDGNVLPAPAHMVGVSIQNVNRADFYNVTLEGIVSLAREAVPPMTTVNFVSRCVDVEALRTSTNISIISRTEVKSLADLDIALPDNADVRRVRTLAQQVTNGIPRGWEQIEAIQTHLRKNYTVDREAYADPETNTPLADFLFKKRRGPEYLFASAGVVMLRSLGYSSRLVSGFYVRPDKYDGKAQNTPVHAADAHFWCEVSIGSSTWITVEPSPGYDVLAPPPGLWLRIWNFIKSIAALIADNAVLCLTLAVALVTCFLLRRHLQDQLLTLRWLFATGISPRRKAVALAALIDHRLRLAGLQRQPGTTLRRWSQQPVLAPLRQHFVRLAAIADEAKYGTDQSCEPEAAELKSLANELSFRQLRQLRRAGSKAESAAQAV